MRGNVVATLLCVKPIICIINHGLCSCYIVYCYMKYILLLFFVFMAIGGKSASAQMISSGGVGQASYRVQSKKQAQEEALFKAKMNALSRYASGFDIAKSSNFDKIRPIVEIEIDRFVTDYVMVGETQDREKELFRVEITANIDGNALEKELSKVSGMSPANSEGSAFISFVFVAREAKSVKNFDARRSVQLQVEESDDEAEATTADDAAIGISASRSYSARATVGGSTLRKADEILWDVTTVNEIDTAMNNVFTTSGYEVVDAVDVFEASNGMLDSEGFKTDYRTGDDISATTRRTAIAGCKLAELDYFATGTLDIDLYENLSGNLVKVGVSVTGKVWSIKSKFPKVVASVGPINLAGLGATPREAKLNGLKAAGEQVARELVSQLRMKGIQ